MLAVAFENWTRHLSERGFDGSFITLLRASGFFDIHFLHGPFEFGKDFIAKRREDGAEIQYAFQSKAGDIDTPDWCKLYAQLNELTSGAPATVGFDRNLPRRSILVTTGRLLGKVPTSAGIFRDQVRARGEGEFQTWEIDTLLEMVQGAGPCAIKPTQAGASIMARILANAATDLDLEVWLAQFADDAASGGERLQRALLDNAICGSVMAEQNRPLNQLTIALNAIRLSAIRAHADQAEGRELLQLALADYVAQGESCFRELLETPADPTVWLAWCGCISGHIVAYPVLCLRVLEFLGLALLAVDGKDQVRSTRLLGCAKQILLNQPGANHPISDRFAVSLAPIALALHIHGETALAQAFLRATAKWTLDRYDNDGLGLAGPYATPTDEVRVLLGAPFEAVPLEARRDSLILAAIADLAYYIAPELYSKVVNDMQAVEIFPTNLHGMDDPGAYRVACQSATRPLVNIAYPESAAIGLLPHHELQSSPRVPESLAGVAAVLALACLARDRLFSDCYPRANRGARGERSSPQAQDGIDGRKCGG
jgi:hypothetical protein